MRAPRLRWAGALALLTLATATAATAAETTRIELPNGIVLLVLPSRASDVAAVDVFVRAGVGEEGDQPGIRELTQRMLLRGTTHRTGDQMAQEIDAVGGNVEISVGLDYMEMYAVLMAEDLPVAIKLLADALRHPLLDAAEFEGQKRFMRDQVARMTESPFEATFSAFRELLYPGHPYGAASTGTGVSLDRVTHDDVVRFHATHYVPANIVIAICGNVSVTEMEAEVGRWFGDWTGPKPERRALPAVIPLAQSDVRILETAAPASYLMLGFAAPAVSSPDYATMEVIDSLLSGGMSSRLVRRVREAEGMAYQVGTYYPATVGASHFAAYVPTNTFNLGRVKDMLVDEFARLQTEPVSAEELAAAKRKLLGRYAVEHQPMRRQAFYLGWYESLGVGAQFDRDYPAAIELVTSNDIMEVAQRYFVNYALAVVVPAAE